MNGIATQSDSPARQQALRTDHSYIVQAPAGSGKTTLLTQRYLALLAECTRPEAVIAITFTQKAAAEMRHRVLDALLRARRGEAPQHPADADTLRLASRALARADAAGWPIDTQPSRLRIQTIDALHRWLSERLPMLSRTGVTLSVEPRPDELYLLAAQRTIRAIDTPGPLADALATVLVHLENETGRCQQLLAAMLKTRERWLPKIASGVFADDQAYRQDMEALLGRLAQRALEALAARLRTLDLAPLVALAIGAAQRLQTEGEATAALAELAPDAQPGDPSQLPAWQTLGRLLLTQGGEWRRRITVNEGFPAKHPDKAAFVDWINQLADDDDLRARLAAVMELPPTRYPDAEWAVVRALHQVLLHAASELRVVFAERRQVDFVEIAQSARLALGTVEQPTDLAITLDERIEHLLVDEFQDTSNAQVQLLRVLTADWSGEDGRTLFLVGDPMQSIYGFREANVSRFLAIQRCGLGHVPLKPLTLTQNFRSRPELVNWFNSTFTVALPQEDDLDRGAVRYTPAIASRTPSGQDAVGLKVCVNGRYADEAAAVVDVIRRERTERPEARIAVLGLARSHLAPVASALLQANIDFQGVALMPLTQRLVVRDLVSLTRAIVHTGDRMAWLACLRAPWCGLPLAALEPLAAAADQSTVWQRLNDEAVLATLPSADAERARAFRHRLRRALDTRGEVTLAACVERTWRALGGPDLVDDATDLANADVYFQRLHELERAGDLEDPARLEDQLADLYAAPSQTATHLQLLTIHRAKGLEWDVVILTGLGRKPRSNDRQLLEWLAFNDTDDAETRVLLAPHQARGRAKNDDEPLQRWLRARGAERTAHELARLLYVATTRARERLWIVCHALAGEQDELRPPPTGTLLEPLWPAITDMTSEASARVRTATDAAPEAPSQAPITYLTRIARPPPAAAEVAIRVEEGVAGPEEFEFEWVTASARHVGTVVHEELERVASGRLALQTAWGAREPHWRRRLRELGVDRDRLDDAVARTARALERTAADPRGRWILSTAHQDASCELGLSTLQQGAVRAARIDRSFIDDGVRWIIDFKTSLHEGGDLESFIDREKERYRAQLEHYAALLRARDGTATIRLGLYFPLHAAWREWLAPTSPG